MSKISNTHATVPSAENPGAAHIARVEAAIRTLAHAGAREGYRTSTGHGLPVGGAIYCLVKAPIAMALARAEVDLTGYLAQFAGKEHVAIFSKALNAELFEQYDRPRLAAPGKRQ